MVVEESQVERKPFMTMLEAKRWMGLPDDYRLDLVPNEVALPGDMNAHD